MFDLAAAAQQRSWLCAVIVAGMSVATVAPAQELPSAKVSAAAELTGTVREQGTRDPLPGIKVTLRKSLDDPSPLVTETDDEGRFRFAELTPGPAWLELRATRIRTTKGQESLPAGRLEVVYFAPPVGNPFEVVVKAAPLRREVVSTTLSVAELKKIPGGQNDPIKAVQNLPGVARAPFGAGQIVVWGSAPGDTRVYADGVQIPRVYHFGGVRSTISAEFVTDVRFRPGAYNADYGRGLGGVIEVTTRRPKSDRWHGSATLDLIDGNLTVEGPITKRLHVAAGGRVSWISALLPLFNTGGTQLSPFYWDYQASLHYQASAKDDLDLLVFGATSNITAKVDDPDPNSRVNIDSKSYFGRARLRWTRRISPSTVFWITPSLGGDTFKVDTGAEGLGGQRINLQVMQLGYNLRAELRQKWGRLFDYALGLDFEGTRARVETIMPLAQGAADSQNIPVGGGDMVKDAGRSENGFFGDGLFSSSTGPSLRELLIYHLLQTSPYLITRFHLADDRIEVSPQLRVSLDYLRLPSRSEDSEATATTTVSRSLPFVEPRLSVRGVLIPDRWALTLGLGLYHQAPQGAELSPRFGNPYLQWQSGTHYVLGSDLDLPSGLHLELQGFYKDLRSLVVSDAEKIYGNEGLGRVYGGELLLRQPLWHGLWGFLAYTVSRSERRDHPDEPWRLFRFDQTHILTAVLTYELPWGLVAGARFRYVTGNPTTPVVGAVRNSWGQSYEGISGEPNSVRLPDFHQLDLRVDKTFLLQRFRFGLYLEVQNLYNRKNAESLIYGGRQLYQEGRVVGLPVFPNLGLRFDY
jgi:hypothetical protein